ncbi:M4 family metallopeptidase [Paenibacillus sp. NEAU-GSW1]|uniref:M4 family metallopeptidase n=1 Tax=Paenibacillus sp. NEAU-GSW1 TaxID=2682486 RepID=UPI0012E0EA24|nr:M4 family metallopeptidase [Paenibacillus sp. NEAU-GSW1]MUT65034.1 hypothetical protein [Paenibacillus sp. NEAU-GSW1]
MKIFKSALSAMLVTALFLSISQAAFAASSSPIGFDDAGQVTKEVSEGTVFAEGVQSKPLNTDASVLQFASGINGAGQGLTATKTQTQTQFVVNKKATDEQGQDHYTLQEQYKGLPIYGSYMQVNLNQNNEVYAVQDKTGNVLNLSNLDIAPSISGEEAIASYQKHLGEQLGQAIELQTKMKKIELPAPSSELLIYPLDNNVQLAYKVNLSFLKPEPGNWVAYINAHTGEIIAQYNSIHNADVYEQFTPTTGTGIGNNMKSKPLNISTKTIGDELYYYLIDKTHTGVIETAWYDYETDDYYYTISRTRNFNGNAEAVDAHFNADVVYDFYLKNYGRDSINGKGMDVLSAVNEPIPNNAYWYGLEDGTGFMFYGIGTGTETGGMNCLACGLDIVAHELTHGVTQNTANLEYQNQSGALNESMSDIMAAVIDGNWTIAEDTGKIIRDMANPGRFGDPAHMDDYWDLQNTEEQDWGGVHINSGIPNHAAYLLSNKLDKAGLKGKELLGKIAYSALSYYLTPTSNFRDARNSFLIAVSNLDGLKPAQIEAVRKAVNEAWAEVGISNTGAQTISDLYVASKDSGEGTTTATATLTWTPASGAKSVELQQSSDNINWTKTTAQIDPTDSSVLLSGINTTKPAYFRLYVVEGTNEGYSNVAVVSFAQGKIVSFALDSKSYDSATLKWTLSQNPTSLEIKQSKDGKTWTTSTLEEAWNVKSSKATVIGLELGKTYKFKLIVTLEEFPSPALESSVISVPITPIPLTGLQATDTVTSSTANIEWSPAVDATSIVVQQAEGASSTWKNAMTSEAINPITGNAASITNLLPGTTYRFRLSVTGGRNAGLSNEVKMTTAIQEVSEFKFASATANSITLEWPALVRATAVKVQIYDGVEWIDANTGKIAASAKKATVTKLPNPNTSYQFRLFVTGGGNAGPSNPVTAKTLGIPLTTFKNIGKTAETAQFTFTNPDNAEDVIVQYSTDGGKFWHDHINAVISAGDKPGTSVAAVDWLSPNTTYQFRLSVIGGMNEGYSNVVKVATPPKPLGKPEVNNDSINGNSLEINWTPAVNAKTVTVMQSTNGKSWTKAKTEPFAVTDGSAVVTGLLPDTPYQFRLVVVNGQNHGTSETSDTVSTAFEMVIGAITTNSIVLNWPTLPTAPTGKSYKLMQSNDQGNTWNPVTSVRVTQTLKTATVRSLTANTYYNFKIVLIDNVTLEEENVVFEAAGTTLSIPIKNMAVVSKANTTIDLKWTAAIGASEVIVEVIPADSDWSNIADVMTYDVIDPAGYSIKIDGLIQNTNYKFRLFVVGGQNDGYSNIVTARTTNIK